MTDPGQALDDGVTWWDAVKFKAGFLVGFVTAIGLMWMGK